MQFPHDKPKNSHAVGMAKRLALMRTAHDGKQCEKRAKARGMQAGGQETLTGGA